MKTYIQTFFCLLSLCCAVFSTPLSAQCDGWLQKKPYKENEPTHCEETFVDNFEESAPFFWNFRGIWQAKASVLLWTACRQHTDFALLKEDSLSSSVFTSPAPTYTIGFDWDTGYRFSLEYFFCNSHSFSPWSIRAEFTSVDLHGSAKATASSLPPLLVPTRLPNMPNFPADPTSDPNSIHLIDSSFTINYYSIDAVFCYNSPVGCLSLQPLIGAKSVGIDQKMHVKYIDSSSVEVGQSSWDSHLSAVGMQTGSTASLPLFTDFTLSVLAAGSIMAASTDSDQAHLYLGERSVFSVKEDFCLFGAQIGASIEYRFFWLCSYFSLGLSYEFQWFSDIPSQRRIANLASLDEYQYRSDFYEGSGSTLGLHGSCLYLQVTF